MGVAIRSLVIGLLATAVIVTAILLGVSRSTSPPTTAGAALVTRTQTKTRPPTPAYTMPSCPAPTGAAPEQGDPRTRAAAQRGLAFLSRETIAWQKQHACFGCHVHAVTLEAMAVGVHHQYDVPRTELLQIVTGMQTLPGGVRTPAGFSYHGDSLMPPSQAFGGAAFARYDEWVGTELRADLLKTAEQLIAHQRPNGAIEVSWNNPPVGAGEVHATFQAAQTWRQAYARTADEKWLLPLQRAERYITAQAKDWQQAPPSSIQELNYALLGLTSAGMGSSEPMIHALEKQLVARQNTDGGWDFAGKTSNAFATGQTLYTLRTLGRSDSDPIVKLGTTWLLDHQMQDGGWSHAGFGKAEAMWGVLGLVSVDVLSVAVTGVSDGQHADGILTIAAAAKDNQGGGVQKLEIKIDDVLVHGACGATTSYAWNTDGLDVGKHLIDVTATNAGGLTSRRRIEVFTGAYYLTQIGVSSTRVGTDISLRDLAPVTLGGKVTMDIMQGGTIVATVTEPSIPGAMTLSWSGKTATGTVAAVGRYTARLTLVDGKGAIVQTAEAPFVLDSLEAQARNYGAIQGKLSAKGAGIANTEVQLVDELGKVMATTRSTDDGQYRFKNVDAGKYKLKIMKKGYAPIERDVKADKAKEEAANLDLE